MVGCEEKKRGIGKIIKSEFEFFNEGDLENFLAIKSKMDLIFSELFCYFF